MAAPQRGAPCLDQFESWSCGRGETYTPSTFNKTLVDEDVDEDGNVDDDGGDDYHDDDHDDEGDNDKTF